MSLEELLLELPQKVLKHFEKMEPTQLTFFREIVGETFHVSIKYEADDLYRIETSVTHLTGNGYYSEYVHPRALVRVITHRLFKGLTSYDHP